MVDRTFADYVDLQLPIRAKKMLVSCCLSTAVQVIWSVACDHFIGDHSSSSQNLCSSECTSIHRRYHRIQQRTSSRLHLKRKWLLMRSISFETHDMPTVALEAIALIIKVILAAWLIFGLYRLLNYSRTIFQHKIKVLFFTASISKAYKIWCWWKWTKMSLNSLKSSKAWKWLQSSSMAIAEFSRVQRMTVFSSKCFCCKCWHLYEWQRL